MALLLTRHVGERVIIGEPPNEIIVTICDIDRGKCRIGIEAKRDVPIMRAELVDGTRTDGKRDGVTG